MMDRTALKSWALIVCLMGPAEEARAQSKWLSVRTIRGTVLQVTNIGPGPIEIKDISLNDRDECTMADAFGGYTERVATSRASISKGKDTAYAIEAWSDPQQPLIEEFISKEERHRYWLLTPLISLGTPQRYSFVESQNGKFHANICLNPTKRRADTWILSERQKEQMCGFTNNRPKREIPNYDVCYTLASEPPIIDPSLLTQFDQCEIEAPGAWCNVCNRSDIKRISLDLVPLKKLELKVGEGFERKMTCGGQIVRVTIISDHGTHKYGVQEK